MTHTRTQIRNTIANTTLDGLKQYTGAKEIYVSRLRPTDQYPAIGIYNGPERMEVENPYATDADKRYRRWQDYIIEIAVLESKASDAALDNLSERVEIAMATDEDLALALIAVDLIAVTFNNSTADGSNQLHICNMTYRAEYRTQAVAPDTALK